MDLEKDKKLLKTQGKDKSSGILEGMVSALREGRKASI